MVVDVHAAGVSFPEVLQTRGEYQLKPPLPFVPGSEVGGVVRSAPDGAAVAPGDRVAAFCMLGGFAEVAVAPDVLLLQAPRRARLRPGRRPCPQLPHRLLRAEARAAGCAEGETVLVHGARRRRRAPRRSRSPRASARGRSRVVSSDEKERGGARGRRRRGRSLGRPLEGPGKELSGGGVDIVLDPVGGDRFTDSLRSLREGGRVVVVGFTGGSIPEVKVNRLLLGNTEVVGAGWGAYVMTKPDG